MTLSDYQAREGLNLSQLASRLGRPVSTVHGWLSGARRPDWTSLQAITQATQGAVSAGDFVPAATGPQRGVAEAQSRFGRAAPDAATLAQEACRLGLDPDAIAREALRRAVFAEKSRRWQEENREALEAHNRWVEEHGLPLAEYRMF